LRLLAIPKLVATKHALATKRKATRTAALDAANQCVTAEAALGLTQSSVAPPTANQFLAERKDINSESAKVG
jgi:hypothetical protein